MKLALFGATGQTGNYIINEALKQGYDLTVYARDATKLEEFEGRVRVVVGDLKNTHAIEECIHGANAVISALGPNSIKVVGQRPVMNGLMNIIAAMKKFSVRRLIQISTAAYRDPKDSFDFKAHAMVTVFRIIANKAYDDIKATGELIAQSDLDWTLVRIPNLKEGSADGKVKTGTYGKTRLSMSLYRGNLARFLVDQVEDKAFIRSAPGISNS